VIKPEKDILKLYQDAIGPAFEKQNQLELQNQRLSELRDWLLPMLMNGQIKVQQNCHGNTSGHIHEQAEVVGGTYELL
jgi:type I restriction enzyme S subunit